MPKKAYLIFLCFGFGFLFTSKVSIAESATPNINAQQNSATSVTTSPTTTNAAPVTPQNSDTTSVKPNVPAQDTIKKLHDNGLVPQTNDNKPFNVKQKTELRQQRLKLVKEKRQQYIQKLKEERQTRIKVNKEKLRAEYTEIQAKRLEMIKKRFALNEERLQKAIEFLYTVVEKINLHLQEQKDAGFDVSAYEESLDSIETRLNLLQDKVDNLGILYTDLEGLKREDVKTRIATTKTATIQIVSELKAIINDLSKLIRSTR